MSRFAGIPSRAWLVAGISPYEATSRRRSPSRRKITALFASHRRAAFSAYRVQHRLNLGRRVRDDAQNLGGGGLLLQRLDKALPHLGDLASACFELLFEIGAGRVSSTDAGFRLRAGQTKLAPREFGSSPLCETRSSHRHKEWPPMLVVVAGDVVFQCGENSTQPRARLSPFIGGQHDLPRTGTGSCPAPRRKSGALTRSVSEGSGHSSAGVATHPRRALGRSAAHEPKPPSNRPQYRVL